MARHDLLAILKLEFLKGEFNLQPLKPWGRVEDGIEDTALQFCHKLGAEVLKKFTTHEFFLQAEPVLLGSWARGELTPGSDLDLIFLGSPEPVGKFVSWAQSEGLKIRSRIPENIQNLKEGVQVWDLLSLLEARGLTPYAQEIIEHEKHRMVKASLQQKRRWLKKMLEDKAGRDLRFHSMQNLLEPNIKLGRGGLRDLQQARICLSLFAQERIPSIERVEKILHFYLSAFLWIRLLLNIQGEGNVMVGASQPVLAEKLGFSDYQALMFFVQRGLSRVAFYSDWIFEYCGQRALPGKGQILNGKKETKLSRAQDLGKLLRRDPSVLNQFRVRQNLDLFWPENSLKERSRERGQEISRFFKPKVLAENWQALFRSRLMDRLLPELKPLVGYVQHDQYHRFTADAHILQVLLEVLRARNSRQKKHLKALQGFIDQLTSQDWRHLMWTALYHDLAKARPEDHSDLGEKWVRRDLKAFAEKASTVNEVAWLVKHHLAFSKAALRRDPRDLQLLSELLELGLTKARIRKLLVFTALDILGTNPDSWNEWKAGLLADLGKRLSSQENRIQVRILKLFPRLSETERAGLVQVCEGIGPGKLRMDFQLVKHKTFEVFHVFKIKNQTWIRYYNPQDQTGTLSRVLGVLFQAGVSVLRATVLTLPKVGVYDWFCVDYTGPRELLEKRLKVLSEGIEPTPPNVKWEAVEVVQEQKETWTLLFRAHDQRGLLWNAAHGLSQLGAQIHSASAQTWGQKAEDLFIIQAASDSAADWLTLLKENLGI